MGFLLSWYPEFSHRDEIDGLKKTISILHGSPALVSVHHVCAVLTEATRGHWIPGTGESDTCEHYLGGWAPQT